MKICSWGSRSHLFSRSILTYKCCNIKDAVSPVNYDERGFTYSLGLQTERSWSIWSRLCFRDFSEHLTWDWEIHSLCAVLLVLELVIKHAALKTSPSSLMISQSSRPGRISLKTERIFGEKAEKYVKEIPKRLIIPHRSSRSVSQSQESNPRSGRVVFDGSPQKHPLVIFLHFDPLTHPAMKKKVVKATIAGHVWAACCYIKSETTSVTLRLRLKSFSWLFLLLCNIMRFKKHKMNLENKVMFHETGHANSSVRTQQF